MFYIVRNQKSNLEIGIHVKERPKIPAPEFRYEEIEIPGRSGTLIQESGLVDDLKIEVVFNFAAKPDLWMEQFRKQRNGCWQGKTISWFSVMIWRCSIK